MKTDGLAKDQAINVLKRYLTETRVLMGDGKVSTTLCSLCLDKVVPALQSAHNCVCKEAREIIGGYV